MAYKQDARRPVKEGGTEKLSFNEYSIIIGGQTAPEPLQNAVPGASGTLLISQGVGSPPSFQVPPIDQMKFQLLSADPSSPGDGQVWYRTDLDEFRGSTTDTDGVWTAKTGISTATRGLAAAGQQVDGGIYFGGFTTARVGTTEQYDEGGNSWSALGSLNTARLALAGGGSSSDALSACGDAPGASATTERFDGANWTAKTNANTAVIGGAGTGSDGEDFLKFGGNTGAATAITERYSGTGDSWTNKTSMNTARFSLQNGGSGAATDALSIGGYTGASPFTTVELYEGVGNTWTAKTGLNTGMRSGAAAGIASGNALSCGGNDGAVSAICERYDRAGNTWEVISSLNTARQQFPGLGTATSALTMGGFTTVNVATVEQYSSPVATIYTFDLTAV